MASSKDDIDLKRIPKHIAIIMDGNGRWAKKKGAARIFGHRNAVKAVREAIEGCGELGVKYLTLYAFSTENWSRPKDEVDNLMELLVNTLRKEISSMKENDVRLQAIGQLDNLPENCQQNLADAIAETSNNKGLTVILALSYSGRWEILNAIKEVAMRVQTGKMHAEDIDQSVFESYLQTSGVPDPELLIRTSGEMRISNFLLWQLAYTEMYITETLWPDFRKENLYKAICSYQKRERRFGKISEQVNPV
ncbi:MAG TPA: isoprenyl transferase [Cyclobacteriaceae bacterium]|nr:isoprenyl transferase [Cyclobacteriaceae bacterium]